MTNPSAAFTQNAVSGVYATNPFVNPAPLAQGTSFTLVFQSYVGMVPCVTVAMCDSQMAFSFPTVNQDRTTDLRGSYPNPAPTTVGQLPVFAAPPHNIPFPVAAGVAAQMPTTAGKSSITEITRQEDASVLWIVVYLILLV